MQNSRNGQMRWPVARDFPSESMPSQTSDDERPIFGRCEPVDLKPFNGSGTSYHMTEIPSTKILPVVPK